MASFSSSMLLLFLIPIIITSLTCTTAQPSNALSGAVCSTTGNYNSGSTYGSNLVSLLTYIYSHSTNNFYSLYDGQYPDRAYAVALCRGDVPLSLCSTCIEFATSDILKNCPYKKEAIIIYDYCFLRYSDKSIISGVMDETAVFVSYNVNSVSNPTLFNQEVTLLLKQLTEVAEIGGSTLKYAKGKVISRDYQTIYGLVQCNPDLSKSDCATCLGTIISLVPKYIPGRQGGRVYSPTCNLRFGLSEFYYS